MTPLTATGDPPAPTSHDTEFSAGAGHCIDHVSHEFRTPLTVIKEFNSILREGLAGDLNDRQREYLEIIDDRVHDLTNLVDDLLDTSRLESHSLNARRQTCRFKSILDPVWSGLERKARSNKVKLDLHIHDGLPQLFCDPEQVSRALNNLLIDSIKFCRPGSRVSLEAQPSTDGATAAFTIRDEGPSFSAGSLERVCGTPQGQREVTGTRARGGGLALGIAQRLLRLNLGTLESQQTERGSSQLNITIPASEPQHVMRAFLDTMAATSNDVVTVIVIESDHATGASDTVESLLHSQTEPNDLLLRDRPDRWTWFVNGPADAAEEQFARVEASCGEFNELRHRAGDQIQPEARTLGTWHVATARDRLTRAVADALALHD